MKYKNTKTISGLTDHSVLILWTLSESQIAWLFCPFQEALVALQLELCPYLLARNNREKFL
jgi:hypothetical protein